MSRWAPGSILSPHGGEPLGHPTRARIESILGTRLGEVRIHRGPAATRATASLGAAAFAVGQDVVLDSGVNLGTSRGERLLAHEAAHTVQQSAAATSAPHLPLGLPNVHLRRTAPGGAEEQQAEAAARGLVRPTSGAPLAIAAAPPAQLPFTPLKRFKEIWPEFVRARDALDRAKATALARELATAPNEVNDLLNHGIDLVAWLQQNGEPALAGRVLGDVRNAWMIEFVSLKGELPSTGSLAWDQTDPATLISLGKDAARAGKHEQAFAFFGVANEILSYYALKATEKRGTALEEEDQAKLLQQLGGGNFPAIVARSFQYHDLQRLYGQMREIYGFYYVLEREALTAGDTTGAAAARTKADELHKAIKDKYTWGATQQQGSISQDITEPAEIAEVSYEETPKGPGLTLHGANTAETTLTQLPGLPPPKEVGNNMQVQNLGALQSALMAQTDFQAELARRPEIRKAFGDQPVDLNETAKRQKAWQIMYGVFKQAGPGALGQLMALIGRYLRAFTIHTMYNVRDWGKSYLDSEMPTDLAGRAEKDCGVYALTVAWDVYETVKRADAKLEVTFDLFTMLEHVTLVITDKSTKEFYVVNNDQISGPQTGDLLGQIAPLYGAIRGLPYTVGPAESLSLGSTKDPEKKFKDRAWTQYLASVGWGLKVDVPPEVEKLKKSDPAAYEEKVLALQKARYESFYRDQETFDRETKALDPLVDGLAPVAGDAAKLAPSLDPLVDKAGALALMFIRLGPGAGVVVESAKSPLFGQKSQYLFTLEQGHTVHPITRVALAILHLKALGGTLTPKEDMLLKFCDAVPQFKQQLDAYRAAGATGPF